MGDLYGRPTAAELVAAVRELLSDTVLPAVGAEHAYQLRVAVNALTMVERELEQGASADARHDARLAELGFADNGAWAAAIRSGSAAADAGYQEALADVQDRLSVASPRFVERYA